MYLHVSSFVRIVKRGMGAINRTLRADNGVREKAVMNATTGITGYMCTIQSKYPRPLRALFGYRNEQINKIVIPVRDFS